MIETESNTIAYASIRIDFVIIAETFDRCKLNHHKHWRTHNCFTFVARDAEEDSTNDEKNGLLRDVSRTGFDYR